MFEVVFIQEEKDGYVRMTKKDLEESLHKAYDNGYNDGYKAGSQRTITSPDPNPTIPHGWWETPPYWWNQPMCVNNPCINYKDNCVDKTVPTHIYTDHTTTGTPIPNYGTTISSADYPETKTITAHWNGYEWACGVAPKVDLDQSGGTVVESSSYSPTTK